jgi:hypothetical protein
MQTLLQTSGDEVLYGEVDEDGDYGNGSNVVEDGVVGGGNQGGDVSNYDDDDTLVIANGDVYIIKTNEKLLVVKEIDGSYSIIPVADDVGKFGLGYDDMRQNQIGIALDVAGIEAVIGTTPNLDENILTQTSMYNDIVEQSGILPPDPVNGDIFNVSGDEWVLVAKTDVIFTLIPVKDHPGSSGQLIYDNTRVPMRDLISADVELFLGYRPTLNENIASNTLEFASIKGAGSTGLVNGDVYIVNTDEKLLLVEESDGSYTLIPVADGAGDFTFEYDDTRQDQISTDLDAAGVEAVIGATQYLDENILLKTNMYNDIVQAFPRTPTFLGEVNLADPLGGDPKVSLKVAAVSEFTPGALIGELSYDDGSSDGGAELPIYTYSGGWTIYRSWDDMSTLDPGTYAMDAANDRVFEVTGSVEDGFNFTTGNSIPLAAGQSPGIGPYTNNDDFYTAIDHIKFPSSDNTEANIVFAISGQDLGFSVKGNEVYLNDDWFFNKGWGDNGTMVDASSGGGFGLGDISLSIAVSGDVSATAAIDVIGTNEKYFGLDGAEITAGGGYTFTPMSFNSFEFGDELGTITAASFDFDTVGLPDGDAWIEIVGNTVKLKDTAYYDVNTETFNVDTGGFLSLSELTAKNVTATKGDVDLVSAPILWSNMVDGGQIKQAPYWAGSPAGTKDLPIETNIKALMFEDQDGNGNPIGTTTYWVHDPSQDNSSVGDDIVITYSFVEDSSAKYIEGAGSSGGPNQSTVWSMNDAQKVSVRESLDAWSTVADITFVEVDESASDSLVGTMRFGFTTYKGDLENVAGWATGPGGGTGNGDVWITSTDDDAGVAQRAKDDLFQEGYSQGFLTLLHEIGHALGLAHPFEGYLMEGADPDTGEGAPLDHQKYTVMSYTVDDTVWFNGPAYPDMGYAISHTPMKEDIAAIQWMYGAQETNEDDTVYGSDYFDPETPFAMAIWDSGGLDTIDLSNFTEGCDLSLVSGTSSTVVCKTGGAGWSTGQMLNNLSIASGVIIENIITGSGDDTIVGNDADNLINGGAGADILTGGEGADIFEYNHLSGADRITDFVIGEDTLRFLDTNGDVITSAGDFDVSGIQDLAISYLGGELILEGLNSEHWDVAFLEIV